MYWHIVVPTGSGGSTPESVAFQAPYGFFRGES